MYSKYVFMNAEGLSISLLFQGKFLSDRFLGSDASASYPYTWQAVDDPLMCYIVMMWR